MNLILQGNTHWRELINGVARMVDVIVVEEDSKEEEKATTKEEEGNSVNYVKNLDTL